VLVGRAVRVPSFVVIAAFWVVILIFGVIGVEGVPEGVGFLFLEGSAGDAGFVLAQVDGQQGRCGLVSRLDGAVVVQRELGQPVDQVHLELRQRDLGLQVARQPGGIDRLPPLQRSNKPH
jgi:hypothetical protein